MSDSDEQRVAPAHNTGGGGFAFEDLVGKWLVAAMLAGASPLGKEMGVPDAVEFQQKVPPTGLDDIVVRAAGADGSVSWWASAKSYDMLPAAHLADFALAAWTHVFDDEFSFDRDFVGLVCARSSEQAWTSLQKLIRAARQERQPDRMAAAIGQPGAYNAEDRRIWDALLCPEQLGFEYDVDVSSSPVLLLARLIPLRLDLLDEHGRAETKTLGWCAAALDASGGVRARELAAAVFGMVASTRPAGGSITYQSARKELGRSFALAGRADAAADWTLLDRHTSERLEAVRDELAGAGRLPRAAAHAELAAGDDAAFIYLTGPSGCGKSALAKSWLQDGDCRVWISANDLRDGLSAFAARLHLTRPIGSVLQLGRTPVRMVVDGLDRGEQSTAAEATAALARLAAASGGLLRLMVTCQSAAHQRVVDAIAAANGPMGEVAVVGDFDAGDVELALQRSSDLRRLSFQDGLQEVLRRPKLLDVALRSVAGTGAAQAPPLHDEAAVADLWWDRLALGRGADRAVRGELLLGLAQWTGRHTASGVPAGQLAAAGLGQYAAVAGALRADGTLDSDENVYAFAHDLFADWARYRALGTSPQARTAVLERQQRPAWHRAIRLLALRTLRERGINGWQEEHHELLRHDGQTAADLYLDAPLFAADAETHLSELWPALVAEDGRLLQQMLARFTIQASVVDPRSTLLTQDTDAQFEAMVAATWRVPVWVLWPPVLRALAAHAEQAVQAAPVQVAAIAEKWLESLSPGTTGMDEAAALGLAAGAWAAEHRYAGHGIGRDGHSSMWKAFLAAGAQRPQEVLELGKAILDDTLGSGASRSAEEGGLAWAILGATALAPMTRADPQRAAELILKTMVSGPQPPDEDDDYLGLQPSYGLTSQAAQMGAGPDQGPLLVLFMQDPQVAAATLQTVVDHATEAWSRSSASAIDQLDVGDGFELLIDGRWRALTGNGDVMHWHRGDTRVPHSLACALMGFEQYCYRRLDGQLDGPPLEDVFEHLMSSRSVAVFGVLTEVACYKPELLDGHLSVLSTGAALLTADERYKRRDHSYLLMAFDVYEQRRLRMWHQRKHRDRPLTRFLLERALIDRKGLDELDAGRTRWAQDADRRWRFLTARMDPRFYSAGAEGWHYDQPAELRAEAEADRAAEDSAMWWAAATARLAQSLERPQQLDDNEAAEMWKDLLDHDGQSPPADLTQAGVLNRADVECGVAAVLLCRAHDWVAARPDVRTACRDILLAPLQQPPRAYDAHNPEAFIDTTWDGFAALALPVLWALGPDDGDLRHGAALLATHRHLATVRRFFDAVSRQPALTDDLGRLEALALDWTRLLAARRTWPRRRSDTPSSEEATKKRQADAEDAVQVTFEAFIDATDFVAPSPGDWAALRPRETAAGTGPQTLADSVDLSYLLAAGRHLLDSDAVVTEVERDRRLAIAAILSSALAADIDTEEDDAASYGPLGPHGRAANALTGLLGLSAAEASVDASRVIWQPILAVCTPRRTWAATGLLNGLWKRALRGDGPALNVAPQVNEMMAFAADRDARQQWVGEEVWLDLLCLSRFGAPRIEQRHQDLFAALQPAWSDHADALLDGVWAAQRIVPFLASDVAAGVVDRSLRRLTACDFDDHVVAQQAAEMLVDITARDPALARNNEDLLIVLGRLVCRQNPMAMQLSASLAKSA